MGYAGLFRYSRIYTGILLSAFNATAIVEHFYSRPLYPGIGLSAGAASILILTKSPGERKLFARIDLIIIGIELFLIIHMFMGLPGQHAGTDRCCQTLPGRTLYIVVLDLCVIME